MANCRILLTPLNERDEQRGYSTQGLKRLSGTAKLTPGWGLRELSLCRNFRVNKRDEYFRLPAQIAISAG